METKTSGLAQNLKPWICGSTLNKWRKKLIVIVQMYWYRLKKINTHLACVSTRITFHADCKVISQWMDMILQWQPQLDFLCTTIFSTNKTQEKCRSTKWLPCCFQFHCFILKHLLGLIVGKYRRFCRTSSLATYFCVIFW